MITSGKDVVRRSFECLSTNDLDGLGELLDEQFTLHDRNEEVRGKEAGIAWFRQYAEGFPDLRIDVIEMASVGDLVFSRWIVRGRHDGTLAGIEPTHREIEVHGMEWDRVRDSKIVETWQQWDALSFYEQLGVLEPPQVSASS